MISKDMLLVRAAFPKFTVTAGHRYEQPSAGLLKDWLYIVEDESTETHLLIELSDGVSWKSVEGLVP